MNGLIINDIIYHKLNIGVKYYQLINIIINQV